MLHHEKPSADPIMLAALCGVVAILVCFALGMYWATQPTVLQNAGLAGFEAEMRRATATTTAILARESKRAVKAPDNEFDRQGLDQLARQVASQEVAPVVRPPTLKRVVAAPKRKPLELHAASNPPPTAAPFDPFGSMFR